SVESNIEAYKSRESVFDLSAQAQLYLNKVESADSRNSEIDLQLDILNDIKSYVLSKGKKPGTVPSEMLVTDPMLSSLVSQLYQAEFEADKVKSMSGENSEPMMLAEERVNRLKADILENMA